jgi:hypothetical protein
MNLSRIVAQACAMFAVTLLFCNPVMAKAITENQAIDKVSRLPEVRAWAKLLRSTKGAGNAGYMAAREGPDWNVQVFESRPDHNVTFGFYLVDGRTAAVRKISE